MSGFFFCSLLVFFLCVCVLLLLFFQQGSGWRIKIHTLTSNQRNLCYIEGFIVIELKSHACNVLLHQKREFGKHFNFAISQKEATLDPFSEMKDNDKHDIYRKKVMLMKMCMSCEQQTARSTKKKNEEMWVFEKLSYEYDWEWIYGGE